MNKIDRLIVGDRVIDYLAEAMPNVLIHSDVYEGILFLVLRELHWYAERERERQRQLREPGVN